MTTTQLERLWFQDTGMTALAAARASRRTLRRLHDLGLLEHLDRRVGGVRAGSASFVWTLSAVGGRILEHGRRRQPHEPTPRHLDHVLAVAELVVQIHEAARRGRLEIVSVEVEPRSWREVIPPDGRREWLKPDLRLTVGLGEFELHWFVEVDRATEHRPTLRRKCEAYLRAWREGGELRRVGVAPRVLWVSPSRERSDVIQSAVAEVAAPVGMFVVCTFDDVIAALLGATP